MSDVLSMSAPERIGEALKRSLPHLAPAARDHRASDSERFSLGLSWSLFSREQPIRHASAYRRQDPAFPARSRWSGGWRFRHRWHDLRDLGHSDAAAGGAGFPVRWLGKILARISGPAEGGQLPRTSAVTSESTAIALAGEHATRRNLRWEAPIDAQLMLHRGRPCWSVKSNATGRGFSVEVTIDDGSGTVLATRTLPR
jgi:hypothetical protein